MNQNILSPLWWLWVPTVAMVIQIVMEVFLPQSLLDVMHTESGPHEALQFLILVIAFFVAIRSFWSLSWKDQPLLSGWLLLAAICCFYVGGEEVSWGQHMMGWSTPEGWAQINDQQETNLHNTSDWLDQKPRLLLLIGIVVGGILIPFLQRIRPLLLPVRFKMLYPPKELFLVSLFILIPYFLEKILNFADIYIFTRFSEVQEVYIFYFVLLYLVALRRREITKKPL